MPELLLGDEAVAAAASDAGISGTFSYPGLPRGSALRWMSGNPVKARDPKARTK